MRDHYRAFRHSCGRHQGDHPKVMKSFELDLPEDWKRLSAVDSDGWVDIPPPKEANPAGGRLILMKLKDSEGILFKLVDKQKYDKLVDQLGAKEIVSEDIGAEHKGEFFSSVDAVEYKPEGKVKLTIEHLHTLNVQVQVELRAVDGGLEIRCPS
jgi:hypothetical protein